VLDGAAAAAVGQGLSQVAQEAVMFGAAPAAARAFERRAQPPLAGEPLLFPPPRPPRLVVCAESRPGCARARGAGPCRPAARLEPLDEAGERAGQAQVGTVGLAPAPPCAK
jgi:hypothetical protein